MRRLIHLDILRALSAWVVMAGHLRSAMLPDLSQLPHPGLPLKLLFTFTALGHQAVVVFFVLSGYFVGGAVIRATAFTWSPYLIARLTRLWLVLIPAILVTALADHLLLQLNPAITDAAHIASWHSIPTSGRFELGFDTALLNVLFLQTVLSPVYGSNGPLWSLAYEFWYYMVFPCLWLACRTGQPPLKRLLLLSTGLAVLLAMHDEMRWLFLVWTLGAALNFVPLGWSLLKGRWTGWLLAGAMLSTAVAARAGALPKAHWVLPDLILGLVVALFCAHVHLTQQAANERSWWHRTWLHMSEMSYSLYLLHMPVVFLIVGSLLPQDKLAADAKGLALYGLMIAGVSLLAWTFWWLCERRYPEVRRAVTRKLAAP